MKFMAFSLSQASMKVFPLNRAFPAPSLSTQLLQWCIRLKYNNARKVSVWQGDKVYTTDDHDAFTKFVDYPSLLSIPILQSNREANSTMETQARDGSKETNGHGLEGLWSEFGVNVSLVMVMPHWSHCGPISVVLAKGERNIRITVGMGLF